MPKRLILSTLAVAFVVIAVYVYLSYFRRSARTVQVLAWLRNPVSRSDWMMQAGMRCYGAPFLFPTDGLVGFLWDDSFQAGHRHQGIDIFSGTDLGVTQVVAAYSGYLTRLPDWKSAVIVRVPDDPLQPGRQIWLYYTHMADPNGNSFIAPDFPPGTREKPIDAGTFLGYQGDYSGDPNNPVGVHLHFSIVQDNGYGNFRNELDIRNTLDPSPYLGLALNANENTDTIPVCEYAE